MERRFDSGLFLGIEAPVMAPEGVDKGKRKGFMHVCMSVLYTPVHSSGHGSEPEGDTGGNVNV